MYSVDQLDRVVELEAVPQSSIGAPLPVVLSDEHEIVLAYIVENRPSDWDGFYIRMIDPISSNEPLALIEFISYWSFMFGKPNDEAFHGHPLANRGLHPYGAFQIENSSWIRQLERANSVHHTHEPERFDAFKHFIFAFHDSTFECVAEEFKVSEHRGSMESPSPYA